MKLGCKHLSFANVQSRAADTSEHGFPIKQLLLEELVLTINDNNNNNNALAIDLADILQYLSFVLTYVPLPPSLPQICHILARVVLSPPSPCVHHITNSTTTQIQQLNLVARALPSQERCELTLSLEECVERAPYVQESNNWGTVLTLRALYKHLTYIENLSPSS